MGWDGRALWGVRQTAKETFKETLKTVDRAQKKELVSSLNEVFKSTKIVVVAHYAGLTVAQMTDLRRQVKAVGGQVKVVKNRLVKRALEGTDAAGIADLFQGPTLIAYADDPVAVPKVAVGFAKENEHLVILGGAMGNVVLDEAGVKSLASLPSLDELRGKLIGLLQAPAGQLVRVLSAPGGQLARVLSAYSRKDEAA